MQQGQSSKTRTSAAPRDFTAKWLAPRLAAYGKSDPELRFVLLAADQELDFTEANLDFAIRFADGPNGLEGVKLADGAMATVAAPGSDAATPICWQGSPDIDRINAGRLPVAAAGLALAPAAPGFRPARGPARLAGADLPPGRPP